MTVDARSVHGGGDGIHELLIHPTTTMQEKH